MDERIRRMLAVGKEHYESGDFPRAEEVLTRQGRLFTSLIEPTRERLD